MMHNSGYYRGHEPEHVTEPTECSATQEAIEAERAAWARLYTCDGPGCAFCGNDGPYGDVSTCDFEELPYGDVSTS